MYGRDRKLIQNFNRKFEKKRAIGRYKQRWKDNVEINFK
jgi:hypothetical protein